MIIVGCDYHPSFQQICVCRYRKRRAEGAATGAPRGAEEFYRALAAIGDLCVVFPPSTFQSLLLNRGHPFSDA